MPPRARQPRALKRSAKAGEQESVKQSSASTMPAQGQGKRSSQTTKKSKVTRPVQEATSTDNVDDTDPDADGGVPLPASSPVAPAPKTQRTLSNHEVPASSGSKSIPCIRSAGPGGVPPPLVFTHGAGGGLTAPALVHFAQGFADTGSNIVCFKGNMNLKSRTKMFSMVLAYEKQNSKSVSGWKVVFGGRSMGSRAAVLAAQEDEDVQMLILVSYPLTGPNGDVRDKILSDIKPGVDVLFISGDRDSMCDVEKLKEVRGKMKAKNWMVVVRGADHGMNVKGGKKGTEAVGQETGKIAAAWIAERDATATEMSVSWDDGTESIIGSGIWMSGGLESGQSEELLETKGHGEKDVVKRRRNDENKDMNEPKKRQRNQSKKSTAS
ncbi:hypothetical protein PV08_02435 [Exophiala spinifera]|uniref:KANL3/Tex30 alpha/beta hydrolase-like domain-containing protein n=1 Tax=Exophiala spinifera TaxID=91928 RepID=A0A0D1ZZK6_9EURO|nr:uncharacterized protein PV08_02435 [Exophiala spinifera]KIW18147.1 hypothetical protein PV08_02435 [Exophiala spinifera]